MMTRQVVLVTVFVASARIASADCTAILRPPTAVETKAYANGYALFQRTAPPAPAGWEHRDEQKDAVLKEVCANRGEQITRWQFSRKYSRVDGIEQRRAAAAQETEAMVGRAAATKKTNEAQLADVKRRIADVQQRMQALAAAQKFAEMEAAGAEFAKLLDQQQKLMGLDAMAATMTRVDAEADRDTSASFSMVIGETTVETRGYKPMAVAVGKGYRQDTERDGNPLAALLVVLSSPGAPGRFTVVRISGDRARAEALLAATRMR
jgi:hypothetical protein